MTQERCRLRENKNQGVEYFIVGFERLGRQTLLAGWCWALVKRSGGWELGNQPPPFRGFAVCRGLARHLSTINCISVMVRRRI